MYYTYFITYMYFSSTISIIHTYTHQVTTKSNAAKQARHTTTTHKTSMFHSYGTSTF